MEDVIYSKNYKKLPESEKSRRRANRSKQNIELWNSYTEEEKQIKLKGLFGANGRYSKLELSFGVYLDALNIANQHSFSIGRFQYDYILTGTNILIEINGDFWHANPEKYKASDVLHFPNGHNPTAEDLWKKDKKKIALANKRGYAVITFWESFLKNDDEIIMKGIFDEIKKHTKDSIEV